MKIAALIYKFFPYGGVQLDFLRILEECRKRGHEIVVYAHRWEGECPNYIDLHLMPLKRGSNHGRMAEFGKKCKNQIAKQQFDLVFSVNRLPGLDVYFAGDTCYVAKSHRERPFFYRWLPRYNIYKKLEKSVFAPGTGCSIMLLLPSQQADYEKYFHTEPERFIVLPPGIPADRRRPDDAATVRARKREELGAGKDDIVILQIGSGFVTKGVDRSIRAVASLPAAWRGRIRFLVVGSDKPAKFERLAKKLGIGDKVEFLGGRNDVPGLLLAADMMLHPAVNDATATVLAEAIVAGLPVLCTAACGFSQLIKSARSGVVLSEPFKQEELNVKLGQMLEIPAQLQAYQDNAILYANDTDFFNRQQIAVDFMEQVAGEKAAQ